MANKRLTYAQRQVLADVTADDLFYREALYVLFEWEGVPFPDCLPKKYLRTPAFKELSEEVQHSIHRHYVGARIMPRHVYKHFWKGNKEGYNEYRYESGILTTNYGSTCRISKKIIKEWEEEAFSQYENMPPRHKMDYEQVLYEDLDEDKREEIRNDLTRGGRPLRLYSRGCPPDRLRYQPFDAYMVEPLKVGCLIPRELCETWENERKEYQAKMRAWHHENAIARAKKKQAS